ncbi:MAG TPA: VTT domain-containing protein [Urbifossiella sp.]|jgi:uncharacterized membrane protein YdjX (TVP38/TMEM64 family)|nr:VTT domain-containing protein [Urbifossiella sp.]
MTDPDPLPEVPAPARFNWGRWLVLAGVAAGVAAVLLCGPGEAEVIAESGEWRAAARRNLPAAIGLFVLAEVVLIALWLPVGFWLTVLAGFLFGTWAGTAVVSAASTGGAVLAFLSARYVFAGPLRRAAATRPRVRGALDRIDRGFAAHGAYYVILLRMTPVVPFWLVNLGLGLTAIRLRDFWWASQLGMLPMTVLMATAGAELGEITSFREVLSARVLGAAALMPLIPFVLHHAGSNSKSNLKGKK